MEKPDNLSTKAPDDVEDSEFADIVRERNKQTAARAPQAGGITRGGSDALCENYDAKNSRLWLIVDPSGKFLPRPRMRRSVPPHARPSAREADEEADSWTDRSLYDRCISLSVPGSMTPKIYGNSYEIVQSPDAVVIRYEMIHEARIIPLDSRPQIASSIKQYGRRTRPMGGKHAGRGNDQLSSRRQQQGATESLRLIERFTPVSPNKVEWSVTYDDAKRGRGPGRGRCC